MYDGLEDVLVVIFTPLFYPGFARIMQTTLGANETWIPEDRCRRGRHMLTIEITPE